MKRIELSQGQQRIPQKYCWDIRLRNHLRAGVLAKPCRYRHSITCETSGERRVRLGGPIATRQQRSEGGDEAMTDRVASGSPVRDRPPLDFLSSESSPTSSTRTDRHGLVADVSPQRAVERPRTFRRAQWIVRSRVVRRRVGAFAVLLTPRWGNRFAATKRPPFTGRPPCSSRTHELRTSPWRCWRGAALLRRWSHAAMPTPVRLVHADRVHDGRARSRRRSAALTAAALRMVSMSALGCATRDAQPTRPIMVDRNPAPAMVAPPDAQATVAPPDARATVTTATATPNYAAGSTTFFRVCGPCHSGMWHVPPAGSLGGNGLSEATLRRLVREGRTGARGAMPAIDERTLPEAAMPALIDYLRTTGVVAPS